MRRRDFITLLGGAAAWPLAARGQTNQMRRIGFITGQAADDSEGQARLAAFQQELQTLGWGVGRNTRIEYRWGGGKSRPHSPIREGVGRIHARCHPGLWSSDDGICIAGDPHHSHRIR